MSSPDHLCNSIIDLWQTSPDSKEEKCPVELAGSAEHITIKSQQNNETRDSLWDSDSLVKYSPRPPDIPSIFGYQLVTFTLQHLFWKCCLTFLHSLAGADHHSDTFICVILEALRCCILIALNIVTLLSDVTLLLTYCHSDHHVAGTMVRSPLKWLSLSLCPGRANTTPLTTPHTRHTPLTTGFSPGQLPGPWPYGNCHQKPEQICFYLS